MTPSAPVRIAVVGTVGVPARYGGFETLAEQLAVGVSPQRAALVIYCQRTAYPEVLGSSDFAEHRRVFLPMKANGPSSIFHDALAIAHATFIARADVLLVLGYSGAWTFPIIRLLRPSMRVTINIDGMEWRRDKFGGVARRVLRTLEWFATRFSHQVIVDNVVLVAIATKIYRINPILIAYGGDHTLVPPGLLGLPPGYFLSVARVEPENNCHVILAACAKVGARLVFIGNWCASTYGRSLKAQFAQTPNLTLLDPIYDQVKLAALRSGSIGYIHGHSVGGTNPSLVEALFHTSRLLTFDCEFNRATLDGAGDYFGTQEALELLLATATAGLVPEDVLKYLRERYCWATIVDSYLQACSTPATDDLRININATN